jgi:hypothetical protein
MKPTHLRLAVLANLALVLLLSACEKNVSPSPSRGEYFPTGKGSRWEYITSNGSPFTTVALRDTLLNDTTYTMLGTEAGSPFRAIRYQNGRYYQRYNVYGIFGEEHVFLRDDLPVGGTWTNEGATGGDVYTLVALDAKRTVNGRDYANTLEVQRSRYHNVNGQPTLVPISRSIYARGVGEVASLLDSPDGPILLREYRVEQSK